VSLPSDEINKVRDKIVDWLKEQGFSVEQVSDPKAFFNLSAKRNNLAINIVQNPPLNDCIFIAANVGTDPEMQLILKKMDNQKKQDFLSDLNLTLLKNNELGDFVVQPKPPEDIQAIVIFSRPIFFEELTKAKFFYMVNIMLRTIITIIFTLQKFTGVSPKANLKKQDYSF
jgi:hypothetical protein